MWALERSLVRVAGVEMPVLLVERGSGWDSWERVTPLTVFPALLNFIINFYAPSGHVTHCVALVFPAVNSIAWEGEGGEGGAIPLG